jgi:hypothetical protein
MRNIAGFCLGAAAARRAVAWASRPCHPTRTGGKPVPRLPDARGAHKVTRASCPWGVWGARASRVLARASRPCDGATRRRSRQDAGAPSRWRVFVAATAVWGRLRRRHGRVARVTQSPGRMGGTPMPRKPHGLEARATLRALARVRRAGTRMRAGSERAGRGHEKIAANLVGSRLCGMGCGRRGLRALRVSWLRLAFRHWPPVPGGFRGPGGA